MMRSRHSDRGASSSSRLNPTAMDFTPAARTSSKRKASSSAQSELSGALNTPSEAKQVQVCIDGHQLFGSAEAAADDISSLMANDGAMDEDDFDELEDADAAVVRDVRAVQLLGRPPPPMRRPQPSELLSTTSLRKTAAVNALRDAFRMPAVLLVHNDTAKDGSSASEATHALGQVRYLPLCQYPTSRMSKPELSLYTVLPTHASRIRRAADGKVSTASTVVWPAGKIPVEIYELITDHLARNDVKSLRMVNREFERKVCQSLFRTSVVPFNTELYDMIIDKKTTGLSSRPEYVGKGKMKATEDDLDSWTWQNAKEDKEGKVYKGHGLRVFQGFGPYIKRFGMSFEVSEQQLSQPPGKQLLDPISSYHGTYDWPMANYARFANLNRLENTADETSRMKAAFANLAIVSELGLSVRNGLGWLDGPDKSFRARMLEQPPVVFGASNGARDRLATSAADVLSDLRQCVEKATPRPSFKELTLEQHPLDTPPQKILGLSGTCYSDTHLWSEFAQGSSWPMDISSGTTALVANHDQAAAGDLGDNQLNPNELKKDQKEWLLETEWAQRAFLESYILAVMDNPVVFSQVTTLHITTLSSGLLPMMARGMFWDALPALSNVSLHVSADWRTVQKDEAAYAETKLQNPSTAVSSFHELLTNQILSRESVKKLNIGWADGGEHAQGMYARNSHILPAPLSLLDEVTSIRPSSQLVFPHLEHLTLYNCWVSPPMLEILVRSHAGHELKKLTLDSVSLTTFPHPSTQAQQMQAAAMVLANIQHAHWPNNNQAAMQALQGMPPQQLAQAQQGIHQQMHQMHQMQMLNQNAAAPSQNGAFQPQPAPPPHHLNFGAFNPMVNIFQPAVHAQPQAPLAAAPPVIPAQQAASLTTTTQWMEGHRQGSWPALLNKLSPGPVFADYLPAPQPWETQRPPRPTTNLNTLELISCGYVRLEYNSTFDQSALLDFLGTHTLSPWFRTRAHALMPYMLDGSRDRYLGKIVQFIPQRELDALWYAWGLRSGWQDVEVAEEAEFDGWLMGGTGRVSGVVESGMEVRDHAAAMERDLMAA